MILQDPALLAAELRARVQHARDPYEQAVWLLVLGEADASVAALQRAASQGGATSPRSLNAAQMALLTSHEAGAAEASGAIDDALQRFVPGEREYHATTLALMAGDEERAVSIQASLDSFAAAHGSFRSGKPSAVADITRGLLQRDASRTASGVSALLAWHLRRARQRSEIFNSSRGVLSLDAIVALILAHRRGLEVPIDVAYRSAEVPLLVLHLLEWEGRLLPRAMPIRVITDLVAAAWLRGHGIAIEDPPPHTVMKSRRGASVPRAPSASSEEQMAAARRGLEVRIRGAGHPWQLASWSLMLGDTPGARRHLQAAAADARRRWQASVPAPGLRSRLLAKDNALSNPNLVRDHFALALVVGDETGLRESAGALQGWLRTQEGKGWAIYSHAAGYLDLICDLIGGGERAHPARSEVEQVTGMLPSTRIAAIALFERDPARLRQGLDAMLTEHARSLERKTSPPPPICEPAVHVAAAARRLGLTVDVDALFGDWAVPVDGGRLPCDLLARRLWDVSA